MADPLGLVFSGQDATGAAFKAPWTSYDPYRAEVEIGEKRLAAMQKKKELDDKKKKEALESVIAAPIKYDPYVEMPNRITSKASDYITNLYATGQQDKVQSEANKIAAFSKSTANMINSLADKEKQLIMKAASDPDVIGSELEDNLKILRNPHLASDKLYPEIAQMLEQNRKEANDLRKYNDWMDDELVEDYARAKTSDQLASRFMDLPKEYRRDKWLPGMLNEAKAIMDKNKQQVLEGGGTKFTQGVTEAQAKDIIARNFSGNHLFAGQMRREFRGLDEEQRNKFGDPLTYAKETYFEPLTGDVELRRRSGNFQFNISGGAGQSLNIDPTTNQVFKDPVGGTDPQNPTTYVMPGPVQTTNQQVSTTGQLLGGGAHEFILAAEDEQGAPQSIPGTWSLGTLRNRKSTSPLNITFGPTKDYPVVTKDFKVKLNGVDYTIPAGSMPTEYTFELIKQSGQKVPAGYIKMKPFINSTIVIDGESRFGYVPYDRYKGEVQNQLQQNKKQFNPHPAFGPDKDFIEQTYGIQFAAPSTGSTSGGTTRTGSTTSTVTGGNVR